MDIVLFAKQAPKVLAAVFAVFALRKESCINHCLSFLRLVASSHTYSPMVATEFFGTRQIAIFHFHACSFSLASVVVCLLSQADSLGYSCVDPSSFPPSIIAPQNGHTLNLAFQYSRSSVLNISLQWEQSMLL